MRKSLVVLLGVCLFFSLALAAKSKRTLTLNRDTTVSGTQLKAGDYRIEINDNEVVFLRDGKEVARSAARIEQAPQKSNSDSLRYDGNVLTEIRPGGTTMIVLLGGSGSKATKGGQ